MELFVACFATTFLIRQVIVVVAFNDVDPVVSLDLFNQRVSCKDDRWDLTPVRKTFSICDLRANLSV